MIAVQSYYANKPMLDWELKSWIVSYNRIKQYTDIKDIVIYTNTKKYVPFTENVYLLPDTYKHYFDKGWWQIYKQFLYKTINEPFIHVDSDLIFTKQLPKLTGDIICEKTRGNNVCTGIEDSLNVDRSLMFLCSGIMGSSNIDKSNVAFSENFDLTCKFIESYNEHIHDSYRWTLEESVFSTVCDKHKLNVQALNDTYYIHFQGRLEKINTLNHELVYNLVKEYE